MARDLEQLIAHQHAAQRPGDYVTAPQYARPDDVVVRDGNPSQMGNALGWTFPAYGLIEMNRPLLEQHGVAYEEVLLHERLHAANPQLSEEEVRNAVMSVRYTSAPNQQWYSTAHYEARAPRLEPESLRQAPLYK